MNKKNIIKAFTLVELIVVITILAILGTIALLTLQGYSSDARDTKRKSDILNIEKLTEIGIIKGIKVFTLVDGTGSIIKGGSSGKIQIAGRIGYNTLSGSYKAGDVNYTILGIKREDFYDPKTKDSYKIGVTKFDNQYNIAATIENNGNPDSYIVGDWNPRTVETWPRDKISDNIFYLSGFLAQDTNLRVNDMVRFSSTGVYRITKMQNTQIYVDRIITTPGSNIFLNIQETRFLIAKRDSPYAINVGSGEKYTPYKMR